MFYVQLTPLGGILGPLKSDLGVIWPFQAIILYIYKISIMRYLFRPSGPDFKIYKFRNGGPNQANWLKQNLCSFLSSKNGLQAPCVYMYIKK